MSNKFGRIIAVPVPGPRGGMFDFYLDGVRIPGICEMNIKRRKDHPTQATITVYVDIQEAPDRRVELDK